MVIFAVLYGQMQNLTQSIQTLNYLFLEGIFLHISIMILLLSEEKLKSRQLHMRCYTAGQLWILSCHAVEF